MTLTLEEKREFEERGFILRRGLVTTAAVDRVRVEIEGIHERMAAAPVPGTHVSWEKPQPGRPKRIMQLMASEKVSPTLDALLRGPEVLDVIESLIGPDLCLYHSKLLLKAAGDGSAVPWHQDYAYWQAKENKPLMVNCQLALDPSTRENGCLQFVPGSHAWGLKEHEHADTAFGVYLPGHWHERPDAVAVELRPGDAVFFSALVIHGSAPNASTRDRRMNTFAYDVTGNDRRQQGEVLRGAPRAT